VVSDRPFTGGYSLNAWGKGGKRKRVYYRRGRKVKFRGGKERKSTSIPYVRLIKGGDEVRGGARERKTYFV